MPFYKDVLKGAVKYREKKPGDPESLMTAAGRSVILGRTATPLCTKAIISKHFIIPSFKFLRSPVGFTNATTTTVDQVPVPVPVPIDTK